MARALHARLIVEAAEQGVSLNQWVVQKLVLCGDPWLTGRSQFYA